jgi:eukaryotic-like serine/threonine-protein kinase
MDLAEGALVGSNVRLRRLLGQGGMGSVWVADHLGLQTEVAVKFISADLAKHGEAMARFQREASAAAQLRSPHVVQVFDHGITPAGLPYIVMELLDGEDLAKRVERVPGLPVSEVVLIVTQVCKALGKAHGLGVIHRDIKPENIFLIDSDGEHFVKVLDFGIAKREKDAGLGMTGTGTMVGTPHYMSPEQVLSSKGVDLRSDLWSVAVVAYNALTGALPFTAETLGALCVAISNGTFPPPSRLRPALPPTFDDWFLKALHRDPDARFASARELSESFAQAAGEPRRQALGSIAGASAVGPLPVQPAVPAATAGAFTPPAFAQSHETHAMGVTAVRSSKAALMALIGVGAGVAVAVVVAIAIFLGRRSTAPDPEATVGPVVATTASSEVSPATSASVEAEVAPVLPSSSAAEPAPVPSAKPATRSTRTTRTGSKTATPTDRADRYGF